MNNRRKRVELCTGEGENFHGSGRREVVGAAGAEHTVLLAGMTLTFDPNGAGEPPGMVAWRNAAAALQSQSVFE